MRQIIKSRWVLFITFFSLSISCPGTNALLSAATDDGYDEEEGFASKLPCDLTYMVADLKYNSENGVQICEIQTGRASRFVGFDFVNQGEGLIAQELGFHLSQYSTKGWFIEKDVRDPYTVQELIAYGWRPFASKEQLEEDQNFLDESTKPVFDPSSIHGYSGIVYARRYSLGSFEKFCNEHPGVLVLDASTFDYCGDKLRTNMLFTRHQSLRKIKPNWKLYEKEYSEELAEKILKDIGSKSVVIKPRRSAKGNGVIIVGPESLDGALKYILNGKLDLIYDPDPSYRYWAYDKCDSFIVEEYIPSDPVVATHLEGKEYDGTMRVVFLMAYTENQFDLSFLGCYWKLPEKALSESGSLNDKHKSCGKTPYFCEVDPQIVETVQEQLREGIIQLHHEMLKEPLEEPLVDILG